MEEREERVGRVGWVKRVRGVVNGAGGGGGWGWRGRRGWGRGRGMGRGVVRRVRWRVEREVFRAWRVVVSVGVERRWVVQCVRREVWWCWRRRRGLGFELGLGWEVRRAVSRGWRRVGARTGGGFVMLVGLGKGLRLVKGEEKGKGRGREACLRMGGWGCRRGGLGLSFGGFDRSILGGRIRRIGRLGLRGSGFSLVVALGFLREGGGMIGIPL